jgi:hypothetical protein
VHLINKIERPYFPENHQRMREQVKLCLNRITPGKTPFCYFHVHHLFVTYLYLTCFNPGMESCRSRFLNLSPFLFAPGTCFPRGGSRGAHGSPAESEVFHGNQQRYIKPALNKRLFNIRKPCSSRLKRFKQLFNCNRMKSTFREKKLNKRLINFQKLNDNGT